MFVARIKHFKEETHSLSELKDLEDLVINTMGEDIWNAIMYFHECKLEEKVEEKPAISFIEEGTFNEQIRESGLIKKLVQNIIIDLGNQGYIKKNKNIDKFIPNEEELIEFIDEKLSPGIMNYFE